MDPDPDADSGEGSQEFRRLYRETLLKSVEEAKAGLRRDLDRREDIRAVQRTRVQQEPAPLPMVSISEHILPRVARTDASPVPPSSPAALPALPDTPVAVAVNLVSVEGTLRDTVYITGLTIPP